MTAIQRHLNRLQEGDSGNIMKFKFTEIQSQVSSPVPGKEEPLAATTQAGRVLVDNN